MILRLLLVNDGMFHRIIYQISLVFYCISHRTFPNFVGIPDTRSWLSGSEMCSAWVSRSRMDTTVCITLSVVHECVTATHHGIAPIRQKASSAGNQHANMPIYADTIQYMQYWCLFIRYFDDDEQCPACFTCGEDCVNLLCPAVIPPCDEEQQFKEWVFFFFNCCVNKSWLLCVKQNYPTRWKLLYIVFNMNIGTYPFLMSFLYICSMHLFYDI